MGGLLGGGGGGKGYDAPIFQVIGRASPPPHTHTHFLRLSSVPAAHYFGGEDRKTKPAVLVQVRDYSCLAFLYCFHFPSLGRRVDI